MPVFTIKLSPEEGRRLNRGARLRGQTKSAYVRSLLADRIQTTDDLLHAWEKGDIPQARKRFSRRHAAA
jgi:predicted DNA-binding protein